MQMAAAGGTLSDQQAEWRTMDMAPTIALLLLLCAAGAAYYLLQHRM
jgi:hypothetical protein